MLKGSRSCGHDLHVNTKLQVLKLVGSNYRVKTNGRTDRQTDGQTRSIALLFPLTRSVTQLTAIQLLASFKTVADRESAVLARARADADGIQTAVTRTYRDRRG